MKHTIEELGEFADSNTKGGLTIWQTRHDRRGSTYCPEGKPWGCRFGPGSSKDHYGATPDEAVDAALTEYERAKNPDREALK